LESGLNRRSAGQLLAERRKIAVQDLLPDFAILEPEQSEAGVPIRARCSRPDDVEAPPPGWRHRQGSQQAQRLLPEVVPVHAGLIGGGEDRSRQIAARSLWKSRA